MYRRKFSSIFLFVLTSLLLAGCTGQPKDKWVTTVNNYVAQPSHGSNLSALSNTAYTVGPGDRLQVRVFGEPTLTGEFSVDGSGTISMPLLRSIEIAGLTTQGVEQRIATKLRKKFLRNPNVSVEIRTFRPFYILGEVTRAGQYPFVDGMSVQSAVAIAGGFTPRARRSKVKVTRRISKNNTRTLTLRSSATLLPGDTIVVEERFF
jgi:polysaccharide biosynthesis/export protein